MTEELVIACPPVELKPGMVSANTRNGQSGTSDRLPHVYRAGAMDAAAIPSLIGNKRIYRDGRVEAVTDPREEAQQREASRLAQRQAEWAERNAALREEYRAGFDAPLGYGGAE